MRRRYNELIGPGYLADKVYIQSTDTDRTLISVLSNAAGLFPPTEDQIWNESINWQPIPIHTIPLDDDYLVYQDHSCDKIDTLADELLESNDIKSLLDEHNDLIEYLKKHSGIKIRDPGDFEIIYDSLTTEYLRGLP